MLLLFVFRVVLEVDLVFVENEEVWLISYKL